MGFTPWATDEDNFLIENWGDMRIDDISSSLNRSYSGITHRVNKLGLSTRNGRVLVNKPTCKKLTNEESSYIAGFWDGEGTITLSSKLQPIIMVTNTNHNVLSEIHRMIGCGRIIKQPEKRKNWNDKWFLQIFKINDVKKFLEQIIPYLILKKRNAELLLEFCSLRINNRYHVDREVEILEELRNNGR